MAEITGMNIILIILNKEPELIVPSSCSFREAFNVSNITALLGDLSSYSNFSVLSSSNLYVL